MVLNGNGSGLTQTEHYRNLDDPLPGQAPLPFPEGTIVVLQEEAEEPVEEIGIEQRDGSLIIRLDGKKPRKPIRPVPSSTTPISASTSMSASYPVYVTIC